MKNKKLLLSIFSLALCLGCFWLFSGDVLADSFGESGDIKWSYQKHDDRYDGDDDILTIEPIDPDADYAEMPNYSSREEVPWLSGETDASPTVVILKKISYVGSHSFEKLPYLRMVDGDSIAGEYSSGVGDYAFAGCTYLKKLPIPTFNCTGDPVYIGAHAYDGCSAADGTIYLDYGTTLKPYAFRGCKKIEQVCFEMGDNYPNNISEIPTSCFSGCTSLKKCYLPAAVSKIGQYAFYNTGITSVSLRGNVKSVGKGAFKKSKIASAYICGSLRTIGSEIFSSCTKLKKVVFYGAAPKIYSNAFKGVSAKAYYPKNTPSWTKKKRAKYGAKSLAWYRWGFSRPTISSVKNYSGKKATVYWKNLSAKADGYQICYSTSSKFKAGTCHYAQVEGAKKAKCTIYGLSKGKTYYFKVRALIGNLNDDEEYNYIDFTSQYSGAKKIKITK